MDVRFKENPIMYIFLNLYAIFLLLSDDIVCLLKKIKKRKYKNTNLIEEVKKIYANNNRR